MVSTRYLRFLGILGLLAPLGCGATDGEEPIGFVQSAKLNCKPVQKQTEPYHSLIIDLMDTSVHEGFSLTELRVDTDGAIVADVEDLETDYPGTFTALGDINGEDANGGEDEPALARAAMAEALDEMFKHGPLPPYAVAAPPECEPFCEGIPAYSVPENVNTTTRLCTVTVTPETEDSWDTTRKALHQIVPALKDLGNEDSYDPGDGSTNRAPSSTVSATGVVANAYGICPSWAPVGTYCKLSYATGINWTGRWCQFLGGRKRCLLK